MGVVISKSPRLLTDGQTDYRSISMTKALKSQDDSELVWLGDVHDEEYMSKVREKAYSNPQLSWSACIELVKVEWLKERCGRMNKDPVLVLMTEYMDEFERIYRNDLQDFRHSFVSQQARLASLLLKESSSLSPGKRQTWSYDRILPSIGRTILHVAVERNLPEFVSAIVEAEPGLMYVPSQITDSLEAVDGIPLEFALIQRLDEISTMLIKSMRNDEVRSVLAKPENPSYSDMIKGGDMNSTVIAILDTFVDPDWPFLPIDTSDQRQASLLWRKIPDLPSRYHFIYNFLDGDEKGGPPTEDKYNAFSLEKISGMQSAYHLLSVSIRNEMAVKHPVFRMLTARKWNSYGLSLFRVYGLVYLLFLCGFSFSLVAAAQAEDPLKYVTITDYARLVFEVITALSTLFMLFQELVEIARERFRYFRNFLNFLDMTTCCLLIVIIPLRLLNSQSQWVVSALAFLFSCIAVLRYSATFRFLGVYTRTFYRILYNDVSKFAVLFLILTVSFSGCIMLISKTGAKEALNLSEAMFRGVRKLIDSENIFDDYHTLNWVLVTILTAYSVAGSVVLLNLFIAQLSSTYEEVKSVSSIDYDIEVASIISRMEIYSFFGKKHRLRHYVDGVYVNDTSLMKDLYSDWNVEIRDESEENKARAKFIMGHFVKQDKDDDRNQ